MKIFITLFFSSLISYFAIAGMGAGGSMRGKQMEHVILAGNPYGGIGNVDGVGEQALFAQFGEQPVTAVGSNGIVYVGDQYNGAIRKVVISGTVATVTTLAGGVIGGANGTGRAAQFGLSRGLAVDNSGNVFASILTYGVYGDTIRKVTSAGVVTDLVDLGNGNGLVFDGSNFLYTVAECALYKINSTTGVASVFAGATGQCGAINGVSSTARFNDSLRLTINTATQDIFMTDRTNHFIRKVTSQGVTTTFAGVSGTAGSTNGASSTARFNEPSGIAYDSSMNALLVSDSNNHIIRRIDMSGNVSLFAGSAGSSDLVEGVSSTARFRYPTGISTNNTGTFYFMDNYGEGLRQITSAGVVTYLAGNAKYFYGDVNGTGITARFDNPYHGTVDASGNVYIMTSSSGNYRINKITPRGVTSYFVNGFPNGCFDNTGQVIVHPNGNLYAAINGCHRIFQVTSAGVITSFVGFGTASSTEGTGASAGLDSPRSLVVASNGDMYFSHNGRAIRKVTTAGVTSLFVGDKTTAGYTDATGTSARFENIISLAIDSQDNIYVGEANKGTIRKVTSAGVVSTLIGLRDTLGLTNATGAAARLRSARSMAVDGKNNIYFCDDNNNVLRKVTPAGVVTTYMGGASDGGVPIKGIKMGPLPAALPDYTCSVFYKNNILYLIINDAVTMIPASN